MDTSFVYEYMIDPTNNMKHLEKWILAFELPTLLPNIMSKQLTAMNKCRSNTVVPTYLCWFHSSFIYLFVVVSAHYLGLTLL